MPIDYNIINNLKPVQLTSPLDSYTRLMQVQQLQNQNRLANAQVAESEALGIERNMLRKLNPNSPDYEEQLTRVNPKLGMEYRKDRKLGEKTDQEIVASKAVQGKNEQETAESKRKAAREEYDGAIKRASEARTPQVAIGFIQDALAKGKIDQAKADQESQLLLTLGPEDYQKWRFEKLQGLISAKDQLEFSFLSANQKAINELGKGQLKVAETNAQTNKQQVGISAGNLGVAQARLAMDKANGQAPIPLKIQDPTDPTKTIVVDARSLNQPTGPRVLGNAPMSDGQLAATVKDKAGQSKVATAQNNFAEIIKTTRENIQKLRNDSGIGSEKDMGISNLNANLTTSIPGGQSLARATGSKSQGLRDQIDASRLRFLKVMKNLEGTSSGELNSNVELTTALNSLGNPGQSYETYNRILNDIERIVLADPAKRTPWTEPDAAQTKGKKDLWRVVK